MKACIVVPTNRPEMAQKFLEAWAEEFRGHSIILVEDGPGRSFEVPDGVTHLCWQDIDRILGKRAWVIPRHSGAIRNFGIWYGMSSMVDMFVLLDDDCLPTGKRGFLDKHWKALNEDGCSLPIWDTMQYGRGVRPRGFPKEWVSTPTVLNHGLWNWIPDIDGQTQIEHQDLRVRFDPHSVQIPHGVLFPMSAMNVAFRPHIAAAMYQLPMGEGQPFHRFDDIWCGWIMKKACDTMGLSVRSGAPFVEHVRASDAKRNAEIEAPGILENEQVWRIVHDCEPRTTSLDACLNHIYWHLSKLGPYWEKAYEAAAVWREMMAEVPCRVAV